MLLDGRQRVTWRWGGDASLVQDLGDQLDAFLVGAALVQGPADLAGDLGGRDAAQPAGQADPGGLVEVGGSISDGSYADLKADTLGRYYPR